MNPSNGFFNNLFGTIASSSALGRIPTGIDFIPDGSNGETITIKGDSAAWLGMKLPIVQKAAYESCYPVSAVVDKLAESDITGVVEFLRAGGKGKENILTSEWAKQMTRLFTTPNPLQSWEQFRGQQIVYKKVFGFCPVFPYVPAGFGPEFATAMINLPPWLFTPEPTNKIFYKSKIEEIVRKYKATIMGGETLELDPKDIFILKDSFMPDYERNGMILPQSRLVGLDMAISNICAAMEADNVLLRKKGPLGFISHEVAAGKDVVGYQPMRDEDKKEIQKDLQKYGLSWDQYQYVVSKVAARWNPMSFDVRGLGTKETVLAGARAICQRLGFPYVLFEDSESTFSNQSTAYLKLYDDNVIPNNKRDMSEYAIFFKAAENNAKIVTNYDDLSIFKEDDLNEAQARSANDNALQIEYLNDIITKNQWLEELGLDKVADGDLYYSQSGAKKAEDAKLAAQQAAQEAEAMNNPPVIE